MQSSGVLSWTWAKQRVWSGSGLPPAPLLPWPLHSISDSSLQIPVMPPVLTAYVVHIALPLVACPSLLALLPHLKRQQLLGGILLPSVNIWPKSWPVSAFHLVPLDPPWRSAQQVSEWKVCPSLTNLHQKLCSISITLLPWGITSFKLEIVCNIVAEKSNENCEAACPCPGMTVSPHSPLLSYTQESSPSPTSSEILVPSLFNLQIISPSSKPDHSGAYTWQRHFQPEWLDWSYIWKQHLLKCQTTWTGDATSPALSAAEWVVATSS